MGFRVWAGTIYCGTLVVTRDLLLRSFFNYRGFATDPCKIRTYKHLRLERYE